MKKFSRKTLETDVLAIFDADKIELKTGLPFFDHMLRTFAVHSGYGIVIRAEGDNEHHIIEDVAICLGKAVSEVKKEGLKRYGYAIVPMDEAVAMCGIDFSGRGVFVLDGEIPDNRDMSFEDFYHFFDTFCRNSGINAYLQVKGRNSHHMMEAAFKAFAMSFRDALSKSGEGVRSAKGRLD